MWLGWDINGRTPYALYYGGNNSITLRNINDTFQGYSQNNFRWINTNN